jgi:hypothetical protein
MSAKLKRGVRAPGKTDGERAASYATPPWLNITCLGEVTTGGAAESNRGAVGVTASARRGNLPLIIQASLRDTDQLELLIRRAAIGALIELHTVARATAGNLERFAAQVVPELVVAATDINDVPLVVGV